MVGYLLRWYLFDVEKYGGVRADGRDACVEMESDKSNTITRKKVASAESSS